MLSLGREMGPKNVAPCPKGSRPEEQFFRPTREQSAFRQPSLKTVLQTSSRMARE